MLVCSEGGPPVAVDSWEMLWNVLSYLSLKILLDPSIDLENNILQFPGL